MKRIIDQLRQKFPGTWKYNQEMFRWEGPDFNVQAFAAFAPRYDGDDDSFRTEYRRSDNHDQIYVGKLWEFDTFDELMRKMNKKLVQPNWKRHIAKNDDRCRFDSYHKHQMSKKNTLVPCNNCSKKTDWTEDECVWICSRRKKQIYRLYFCTDCFTETAGDDILEKIFNEGEVQF